MNTRPILYIRNSLWLFFPLFIICCFTIQQSFANSTPMRGITIDDLSAIKDIKTMTVSPDGKYVAFQTMQGNKDTNEYTAEWYVATTQPHAKIRKIAGGGEAVPERTRFGRPGGQLTPSDIIWSPDSEWVYFTKKYNEEVQIWRSHISRSKEEQMTHNAGDVDVLKISPDGSKIFFIIGRTRAEIAVFIKKDGEKGYIQGANVRYSLEGGVIIPPCVDKKKYKEALKLKKDVCRWTQWIYDIKSKVERKATPDDIEALPHKEYSFHDMVLRGIYRGTSMHNIMLRKSSPDGAQRAWIENKDSDVYKGVSPPMTLSQSKDDKTIRCFARECTSQRGIGFRGLWWHPNGKEIIFQVIDGPYNTLYSFYGWTPGSENVRTILRGDDRFTDCTITGKRLICGRETWISPKEIASINLDDGKVSTLVDVNPEFKNFKFTKIEKIFGKDDYGHKVYAHLVYPKGYKKGQRYPLVITQYHSYGFLRGATGDEQPIHVYAQNGMAVLSIDHQMSNRTATMYIGDTLKRNTKAYTDWIIRQGPATAIENMVDALTERGIIDPKRVGISGMSSGASFTDTALIRKNYAAASTAYSNIASRNLYSPLSLVGKVDFAVYGGGPYSAKGSKMRARFAVDANAENIDTPYLLQIADREYYNTIINYNALIDAGKPVEMVIYPNEYHGKWQPSHKYMTYSRNLDWFNFWLRDVEDPAPEKTEQYTRWHKLRDMHLANLEKLDGKKLVKK